MCVCAQDVGKYAEVEHLSAGLLEDLLPGPITILLNKKTESDLSVSCSVKLQFDRVFLLPKPSLNSSVRMLSLRRKA